MPTGGTGSISGWPGFRSVISETPFLSFFSSYSRGQVPVVRMANPSIPSNSSQTPRSETSSSAAAIETRVVAPGPRDRTVVTESGEVLPVPPTWELLAPGDAGVTRRVKAAGPTWTVKEKKGRRMFSRGVWADADQIANATAAMKATRSTAGYAKQKAKAKQKREEKQTAYVQDFHLAVVTYLDFDPRYRELAMRLATAVTEHATPVGSGTVARTERIPIERRAESAVIAWMRHQTTAYDEMKIARIKGKRREVRRALAAESKRLLAKYRRGAIDAQDGCPLARALNRPDDR